MAVADIRFAGGSAFGLEAASGVVRYLEARNIGFSTPGGIVPIVPTAVVYDLGYGDSAFRPDSAMGYEAACAASSHPPEQVSVDAGAGATVGKILGISRAMKGDALYTRRWTGTSLWPLPQGLPGGREIPCRRPPSGPALWRKRS